MSTLAHAAIRAACRNRLQRLHAETKPIWGKMTAPQMVRHLIDSFRVGSGERWASPATGLLQRTFIKWVALRTPMPWPRGMPTRPEVEQGVGGTPPGAWEEDCAELVRLIDDFAERETLGTHPIFGKLARRDWLTWGYRHIDHHFQQFGV